MSAKLDKHIIQWCQENPHRQTSISVKEIQNELKGYDFKETKSKVSYYLGSLSTRHIEYTLVDDSPVKPPHYVFSYMHTKTQRMGL